VKYLSNVDDENILDENVLFVREIIVIRYEMVAAAHCSPATPQNIDSLRRENIIIYIYIY
jgi:phosphatidylinositol kinase/protein kinase (PI-3  family)